MSYSFSVTAANKAEAKQKIADSFDNVVKSQPSHAADRDAAVSAGSAIVDILRDPADGQEIHVSMYGSLSWLHDAPDAFIGAAATVNASVRAKPAD
jgi:hypothetical protein